MIARVRDRAQFNGFQSAPRVRCGSLTLRVAPSVRPGSPSVAYSIGRPVGNAVRRNRIRRQLRARVQREVDLLDPNRAYLVSVHPKGTESDLADALSDCFRRAVGL